STDSLPPPFTRPWPNRRRPDAARGCERFVPDPKARNRQIQFLRTDLIRPGAAVRVDEVRCLFPPAIDEKENGSRLRQGVPTPKLHSVQAVNTRMINPVWQHRQYSGDSGKLLGMPRTEVRFGNSRRGSAPPV